MTEVRAREGGDLTALSLESAINRLWNLTATSGPASLVGKDALRIRWEDEVLYVEFLRARSASGRLVEVEHEPIPLAAAPVGTLVRLGIDWTPVPVADGSSISVGSPKLVPLADGESGVDGELTLARRADDGFQLLPIRAERVDSAAANRDWSESMDGRLLQIDEQLQRLAARLHVSGGPVLVWSHVLAGCSVSVALAQNSPAHGSFAERIQKLNACVGAFVSTQKRARFGADRDVVELLDLLALDDRQQVDLCLQDDIPSVCAQIDRDLASLHRRLTEVLETCGVTPQCLPERLYHNGRMHRRVETLDTVREEVGSGTLHRLNSADLQRRCVAVLWRSKHQLLFGDIRCAQRSVVGLSIPADETFLGGFCGTDFHWLDKRVPAALSLMAPGEVDLLEVAVYEPLLDGRS